MKKASTTWNHASLIVLFIVLVFSSIAAAKAVESTDEESLDDEAFCDGLADKIGSILELGQFEVDESITGSTPHWIFLVGGKDDKKQLLKFIKTFDLPNKQTNEWKRVLKKLWKKYPITLEEGVIVLDLSKKKAEREIILTKEEEGILGELSAAMADRMEESGEPLAEKGEEGRIIVQWGQVPTHTDITKIAFMKEGVPQVYAEVAQEYSIKPDEMGFPVQQSTHYLNPDFYTGQAQIFCELYADMALKEYLNHHWYDAYSQLGYSSHFLADVGNPMHTGAELQQGITSALDLSIHKAYETYVSDNWEKTFRSSLEKADYAIITSSPAMSTLRLAQHSHSHLTELNAHIYWNWIWNRGTFKLNDDHSIYTITDDCLTTTGRYMRGLARYLTTHGPIHFTITPWAGAHGSISPSTPVTVLYREKQTFTISPDPGYTIDTLLVNGVLIEPTTSHTFTNVQSDQTISATFKPVTPPQPGIIPLVKAGDPFDDYKYPQNAPQSDPMVFSCSWDGTGRVYISGNPDSLTGIHADDGYTIDIQPSGASFDAAGHWAHQHPVIDLTSGMRPGTNTFTLIVRNWQGLSMSYGSSTGKGTDQNPYIVQVNSPMVQSMTVGPLIETNSEQEVFIPNESVEKSEGIIIDLEPQESG